MHPDTVTVIFKHIFKTHINVMIGRSQLHYFWNIYFNACKHLVESVKMCATQGRWLAGLTRQGGALLARAGSTLLCTTGDLPAVFSDNLQIISLILLSPQLRYSCSCLFSWIYDLQEKMKAPRSIVEPKLYKFNWAKNTFPCMILRPM